MPDQYPPISVDPTTTPQYDPIDVTNTPNVSPLTPEVAATRATKAAYGLSETLRQDSDTFYRQFIEGKEPEVRASAAAADDQRRAMVVNGAIKRMAENGPLTYEDANKIRSIVSNWKPSDPNSVIEDAYSVKAVNNIYTANNNLDTTDERPYSWVQDAMKLIPEEFGKTVDLATTYTKQIEYAKMLRQNVQSDLDSQSYFGWTLDQAKMLLQPYMEAKLRGNVPIDVWGGLGTSKEEQAKALLRMTPEEYKKRLTAITQDLKKDNPAIAAAFLDSVIGESTSQIALDNVFTAISIPDIFTVAKGSASLLRKGFLFNDTRMAAKSVVKGLQDASNQPIKAVVADATGDLAEAAVQKEVRTITDGMRGITHSEQEAKEALADVMRADVTAATSNPGRFGQEIVNRLRESYDSFKASLFDTLERVAKVERITPVLATEAGVKALREEIKEAYPGLSNSILNVSAIYQKPLTNTYHADVVIGKPDGSLFLHKQVADNYAKLHGLADYELKQKGLGWYVSISKPVNETTDVVRDFLTATKNSQSPNSWVSAFAGMLRTPEETLAHEQLMNRKIATYAPSELMKVAKETAKEIEGLAKWTLPGSARRQRWQEWERAVKYAQDATDPNFVGPIKPGQQGMQKGYFFKDPAELETFYQQNFKRLPEMKEVEAYFAVKRLGEMDHVLRNLSIYRNMSRVGAENHVLTILDEAGKKISSAPFQGVIRKAFPSGEDTILNMGSKLGSEEYVGGLKKINTKTKRELEGAIKEGRKVIVEVYDPEIRQLQGFGNVGDQRIRYVIADSGNIATKPIDYVNLPYRGGGHFEYDYDHYIKQARIRPERVGRAFRAWYEGDTTFMGLTNRRMGEDFVNKLNAVRQAIKNKDIEGAKALTVQHLPWEWDQVYKWFKPTRGPDGKPRPARLDLNEPFHVVRRDTQIGDLHKDALENRYGTSFKDGTRSGSLARQYQVQYTGSRDAYDLHTLVNEGTVANPVYKLGDPALLDPIPTMNRALSRVTNSFFMDDYKISAVEHWLREATPFLKASESEIRYAPFHAFNTLSKDAWKPGALKETPELIRQLETRHEQIRQFTGVASSTDALLHSWGQKMADSIYGKFGPDGLKLAGINIDPMWLINKVHDPVKFLRSVTFHAKLGLFSVPQFLVQSQTYATIMGIAGFSKAGPGTFAALLHQYSRLRPDMIDGLDRFASRLHIPGTSRWRPGEFKEAWTELRNTGFGNVAGEYALRDDLMSHKVISTGKDKFLDAGTFFFKEGEKSVRLGAWYTAYREFRDAHPTGALTTGDRRVILDRASLLNVNMDRSSNSLMQHGIFSIPAQFLTYQIRAAELFLGKRLTMLERGRMLAWNAGLYGVPASLGVFGYPFGDNLRKSAIDLGYADKINSGWYGAVMNGLPAAMLQAATGNTYNVGERYGNQGFTSLRDALQSDKTLWDLAGGAAGSTFVNTWANADGFRRAMVSYIKGDPGFQMKPEDAADVFKEISSFNSAWRLWAAIHTGRWLTKKEDYATDVTPLNAVFQTLTGLQGQEISDARTMQLLRKDEKSLREYSEKKATEEYHRGIRTMNNDDPKQADSYFARAFTWLKVGGFPENRYGQFISQANKDYESMIARTKWDYYTKDVPETKSFLGIPRDNIPRQRLETYGRDLQKGQGQ